MVRAIMKEVKLDLYNSCTKMYCTRLVEVPLAIFLVGLGGALKIGTVDLQ